jgi:hypothetical protein
LHPRSRPWRPGPRPEVSSRERRSSWPAQKIAANLDALEATRFDLKYGLPGLTHDQLMTTIELYGQQVVPRVRELLS